MELTNEQVLLHPIEVVGRKEIMFEVDWSDPWGGCGREDPTSSLSRKSTRRTGERFPRRPWGSPPPTATPHLFPSTRASSTSSATPPALTGSSLAGQDDLWWKILEFAIARGE